MAENPIAEAFVLIRPSLEGFRAQLQKEVSQAIRAVQAPLVKVPVKFDGKAVAAQAKAEAAVAASAMESALLARGGVILPTAGEEAAGAAKTAASAARKQAIAQEISVMGQLDRQTAALATSTRNLANITEASVGATTEYAAVSAELARAKAIVKAEDDLLVRVEGTLEAAIRTGNNAIIQRVQLLKEEVVAAQGVATGVRNRRADALADMKVARDQATVDAARARNLEQLAKGARASGLSFLGLRGAVLAASSPFLIASAGALALAKALKAATSFEEQLDLFQATAGATADEMVRVSEVSKALGADLTLPAVSAGDAANAMVELAKAGLSVQDAMAGAKGVLQLATAAGIENAQATELAASALNAFGLAGDQAIRVADVLANSANESQGSITDMGVALQQSSAVARQVGFSLEDTAALLTLLARNGLKGSDAGTSLRTALIRLIAPTVRAQKTIQELGLRIRDAQGNVRPEIFAEFGKATENLSSSLRDQIAGELFGQDAIRAVAIFSREGVQGLDAMTAAEKRQGTAADLAAARMKGLAGAARGLASNLETLGISMLEDLLPPLTDILHGFTEFVGGIASAIEGIDKMVAKVPLLEDALGGLSGTLTTSGTDLARQVGALVQVFASGNLVKFGESPATTLERINKPMLETQKSLEEIIPQLEAMRKRFEEAGVPTTNLDRQLKELKEDLDQIKQTGDFTPASTPLNVLESNLKAVKELLDHLPDNVPSAFLENTVRDLERAIKLTQGPVGRLKIAGLPDSADVKQLSEVGDKVHDIVQTILADAQNLNATDKRIAEAAAESVAGGINSLKQFGKEGQDAIAQIGGALGPQFGEQLRAAIDEIDSSLGLATVKVPEGIQDMIDQLASLGPQGAIVLHKIGEDLAKALASGMEDGSDAVKQARDALNDAIKEGNEAVLDSVRQAKTNLESLGDTLSDQVAKLIEVGPIGQAIERLNKQLDALEARVSKRDLGEALRKASRDFQLAQRGIRLLGEPTAAQRQVIKDALEPLNVAVEDARDNIKKAKIGDELKKQEDKAKTATKQATDEIEKLVDQFNKGKISADKFGAVLRDKLAGPLATLKSQGENLGLSFSNDFLRTMEAIVAQAQALVGFVDTPGTTPGQQPVSPGTARSRANQRIAEARDRLTKASENTDKNTRESKLVLDAILKALTPPAPTPPSQRGARSTGSGAVANSAMTQGVAGRGLPRRK